MNKFFQKLPLIAKLMLIGLIPYVFLLFLTMQVYNEKTEKLKIFENYTHYISGSVNINKLIDALQQERKYSFDFAMTKSMRQELVLQRPKTDALINKLLNDKNPSLAGFSEYTKLKELSGIRNQVDSAKIAPNVVMHYYSNTVFRMNTLNTIPPANTPYLGPVYKDLMTQKILSEMITYLGIISSNIYNVLHTKAYMIETLMGTVGTHDVFKSYEQEFFVKARPEVAEEYRNIKDTTAFKPTMEYIDGLFKKFAFDDSYDAQQWSAVSEKGIDELRLFQNRILQKLNSDIRGLYKKEVRARENTLLFLIFALIAVLLSVTYIVYVIKQTMKKLQLASERISDGEIAVGIKPETNDVIGRLAQAIAKIDKNNQVLANAAVAIGKGNFEINIVPRGNGDILGTAISEMKDELQQYSEKMEQLVTERTDDLARSNEDLQQFAHVASHDLKEPLRKIAMFSNILITEHQEGQSEKVKLYLGKIETAAQRMSAMIEGVLSYSTININQPVFERVDLNRVLEGVENDLELAIIQKGATLKYNDIGSIYGMPMLLHQLFYNLINNSLKFSRSDVPPVINISASQVATGTNLGSGKKFPQCIHIIVEDNGIGINPSNAEQMFAIFARLHSKDKYEGTGLGLALCRKIMDRHDGRIYAEGEEGKGTTFHLFFPVR